MVINAQDPNRSETRHDLLSEEANVLQPSTLLPTWQPARFVLVAPKGEKGSVVYEQLEEESDSKNR